MNTVDQMSELQELESFYCEMHKDVYGVKARWYHAESVEQARQDLASLEAALEAEFAREREQQARAVAQFEASVDNCVRSGAQNRETALRWLMDGSSAGGDWEYFCYQNGLPYGYFRDEPLRSMIEAHEYAEWSADLDAISFAQQGV